MKYWSTKHTPLLLNIFPLKRIYRPILRASHTCCHPFDYKKAFLPFAVTNNYEMNIVEQPTGTVITTNTNVERQVDKNKFTRTISVSAIRIDAKLTKEYLNNLGIYSFKKPKIKNVYNVPGSPNERYVLLNESVTIN